MLGRRLYLITLVCVVLLLLESLAPQASSDIKYTYVLYPDGHADIKVVCNVTGRETLELKLEKGYIDMTIIVFSDSEIPLPYILEPDGRIIINTSYLNSVTIEYEAVVGNVSAEVQVDVLISPLGPADVILPLNSALLYFSGSPQVSTLSDPTDKKFYIVLSYDKAGTYKLSFLLLPLLETPTKTPTSQTSPPLEDVGVPTTLILILVGTAAVALLGYFIIRKRLGKEAVIEPLLEQGFDERDKAILKALGSGEATLSELSKLVRLNKSVVWRRLEKLRKLGYVEKGYSRGKSIYRLTQKGSKTLKDLGD
ncbi:MAG: winged helix-turn-helix transcriptional regulator [Desulfurococcaceae archaeon TW002]